MKLLFVDCCISQRGEASRTRLLANAYLETYLKNHPEAVMERVSVPDLKLAPFSADLLNKRDALAHSGKPDDPVFALARQFRDADRIVVAAPYWDLCFPAALRLYIEHICACGVTYHYTETGCHGDCQAKRLVYLTSGGDVERPESLGVLYWKQLCAMFGIERYDYVFAGGMDLGPEACERGLTQACEQARKLAE